VEKFLVPLSDEPAPSSATTFQKYVVFGVSPGSVCAMVFDGGAG
jgi:hypothetical protein